MRTPPGIYAEIGTAMHKSVEESTKQNTLVIDPSVFKVVKEDEVDNLKRYIGKNLARVGNVTGVEKKFQISVLEEAPPLLGFIDQEEYYPSVNYVVVHDHKSNRRIENTEAWRNKLQHKIYAFATRKTYPGISRVRGRVGYINYPDVEIEWEIPVESDQDVYNAFRRVWFSALTYVNWNDSNPTRLRDFPATPHSDCKYCPLAEVCQERISKATTNDLRQIKAVRDFEDAYLEAKSIKEAVDADIEILEKKILEKRDQLRKLAVIQETSSRRSVDFENAYTEIISLAQQHALETGDSSPLDEFYRMRNEIFSVKVGAVEKFVRKFKEEIGIPKIEFSTSYNEKDVIVLKSEVKND
jgi:CRISPR/Cas system-associated exonuclease Cas4 (RecB family)